MRSFKTSAWEKCRRSAKADERFYLSVTTWRRFLNFAREGFCWRKELFLPREPPTKSPPFISRTKYPWPEKLICAENRGPIQDWTPCNLSERHPSPIKKYGPILLANHWQSKFKWRPNNRLTRSNLGLDCLPRAVS